MELYLVYLSFPKVDTTPEEETLSNILRRLIHILTSQDLISVLSEGNNKAELPYKTTKISMRKND